MRKVQKIYFIVLVISSAFSVPAIAFNSQPIYLNLTPPITWHHDGAIFLDPLESGVFYTVTCDITNPNYNKQYPVIIRMGYSVGVDANVKFIMNNIQPKYNQALLNQNINKYVATGVVRTKRGSHLYIRNYDDSDTIYVSNCIATQTT